MLVHPRLTASNHLLLAAPPPGARPPRLHPLGHRRLCAPRRVGCPVPGLWRLRDRRLASGAPPPVRPYRLQSTRLLASGRPPLGLTVTNMAGARDKKKKYT
jgi:hypothetical protein